MRGPNPKGSLQDLMRGSLSKVSGMGQADDVPAQINAPPNTGNDLDSMSDSKDLGIPGGYQDIMGPPPSPQVKPQQGGIPAKLSANEYVLPADVVAHFGDGNSEAGAKLLDHLVAHVRTMKTAKGPKQPPMMKDIIHKVFTGKLNLK